MQSIAPVIGETSTHTFPCHAASVGRARRWLADMLSLHCAVNVPGDVSATAVLLLSELATNSLRHTVSTRFTVAAHVSPGGLRVRVRVEDQGSPTGGTPRLLDAGPQSEGGRGLALVEQFADRWGPLDSAPGVYFHLGRAIPE